LNKLLLLFCCFALIFSLSCRRAQTEYVTIALPDSFSTLDTLTTTASDSAAERIRNLFFNSLVKKDANFDYIGELASDIKTSEDGRTLTFTLREGVKFHNGSDFTSADVKYTFDELFKSNGYKAGAFFDTVDGQRVPHILSLETPDAKTVVFVVGRPAKLGFDGLVLTDDLEMGAILKNYGIGEASVMAILAGEDMVSICAGVDSIYEGHKAVVEAVDTGRISMDRIDQSLKRIATAKSKLCPPLRFEKDRLHELSIEITALNNRLN
jgi:hypothetical protein